MTPYELGFIKRAGDLGYDGRELAAMLKTAGLGATSAAAWDALLNTFNNMATGYRAARLAAVSKPKSPDAGPDYEDPSYKEWADKYSRSIEPDSRWGRGMASIGWVGGNIGTWAHNIARDWNAEMNRARAARGESAKSAPQTRAGRVDVKKIIDPGNRDGKSVSSPPSSPTRPTTGTASVAGSAGSSPLPPPRPFPATSVGGSSPVGASAVRSRRRLASTDKPEQDGSRAPFTGQDAQGRTWVNGVDYTALRQQEAKNRQADNLALKNWLNRGGDLDDLTALERSASGDYYYVGPKGQGRWLPAEQVAKAWARNRGQPTTKTAEVKKVTNYEQGFTTKCAEYGVDPVDLVCSMEKIARGMPRFRRFSRANRRQADLLWELFNGYGGGGGSRFPGGRGGRFPGGRGGRFPGGRGGRPRGGGRPPRPSTVPPVNNTPSFNFTQDLAGYREAKAHYDQLERILKDPNSKYFGPALKDIQARYEALGRWMRDVEANPTYQLGVQYENLQRQNQLQGDRLKKLEASIKARAQKAKLDEAAFQAQRRRLRNIATATGLGGLSTGAIGAASLGSYQYGSTPPAPPTEIAATPTPSTEIAATPSNGDEHEVADNGNGLRVPLHG